jgi:hypothetical protein
MKTIQKLIHAGFASCALASASLPALSWSVWPNIEFEWNTEAAAPPVTLAMADTESDAKDSIRR